MIWRSELAPCFMVAVDCCISIRALHWALPVVYVLCVRAIFLGTHPVSGKMVHKILLPRKFWLSHIRDICKHSVTVYIRKRVDKY
jgi:hypothetical protein